MQKTLAPNFRQSYVLQLTDKTEAEFLKRIGSSDYEKPRMSLKKLSSGL